MKQAIKKLLIAIKQGIQFMGKGKDDMEVGSRYNFGTSRVYP